MPITHQPGTALAFQQQFRPIGQIRIGMQVEFTRSNGSTGKRPARLDTIRLTSADERMLQRAAGVYGGEVVEWPEAPDGDALQLVTEAREIDVLVPGGQPLTQWYEQWGSGGCLRRCTGAEETLSGGPCLCDPDPAVRSELAAKGGACKPTTRVNLLLPDMDVGAWRLVSHSFYAATELPPVVSLLAEFATRSGRPVPARLWIDQRRIKRPNQPPKEFSLPALRSPLTWSDLLDAGGTIAGARPSLPSGDHGARARLPAGDTPLPDDPVSVGGFGTAGPQPAATIPADVLAAALAASQPDVPRAAADPEPPPEPTPPPTEAPAPAGSDGLTTEAFIEAVEREGLGLDPARRLRLERWPDEGYALTASDRAWLLGQLRERADAMVL